MKTRHLKLFILAALVVSAAPFCKLDNRTQHAAAEKTGHLEGTFWQRNDSYGRKINISFEKGGIFLLNLHSVGMQFPGTFTVSGSTVRIVDQYCGTKLPGVYTYNLDSNRLSFVMLDDSLCERRKIMVDGAWSPDTAKNDDPSSR